MGVLFCVDNSIRNKYKGLNITKILNNSNGDDHGYSADTDCPDLRGVFQDSCGIMPSVITPLVYTQVLCNNDEPKPTSARFFAQRLCTDRTFQCDEGWVRLLYKVYGFQ